MFTRRVQAALRRAVGELIFFAGVNDLHRCGKIVHAWGLKLSDEKCADYDRRTPLCATTHAAAALGVMLVCDCCCMMLVRFLFYSLTNISQATRTHLVHSVLLTRVDSRFRFLIATNQNLLERSTLLFVIIFLDAGTSLQPRAHFPRASGFWTTVHQSTL